MATEKRLIDVDYAIDLLGCEDEDIAIKHFLEELPAVDAVEVTRCKNCRYCTVNSHGMVCDRVLPTKRIEDYLITGTTVLALVGPDDFCSHGERKNNDDI